MNGSTPTHLIFDLDNTLYPRESGLFTRINRRISTYMEEFMGFPADEVEFLRLKYMKEYGTTLGGLIRHHGVDPEHYLNYVHDVPVEAILRPDDRLAAILARTSGRKVIFTNGSRAHAARVLAFLKLAPYFDDIMDIAFMDYEAKPAPASFQRLLAALNVSPHNCIYVEDDIRNLNPAQVLGMTTVLVGRTENAGPHLYIPRIHLIGNILAELGLYRE